MLFCSTRFPTEFWLRHESLNRSLNIYIVSYKGQNLFYHKCYKFPTRGIKEKWSTRRISKRAQYASLLLSRGPTRDEICENRADRIYALSEQKPNVDRDFCLQERLINLSLKSYRFEWKEISL